MSNTSMTEDSLVYRLRYWLAKPFAIVACFFFLLTVLFGMVYATVSPDPDYKDYPYHDPSRVH
jgi:hypothetical protein